MTDSFILKSLDDLLCDRPQYGYTAKAATEGPAAMLRTTDITKAAGSAVNWSTVPRCEIEPAHVNKFQLAAGDVLVSRAGTVGVSHVFDNAPPAGSVFASYLIRIRVNTTELLPKYLYWFMQSPSYWTQISTMAAGVAQPNINATKLRELKLPVPHLRTQQRLVQEIERRLIALTHARQSLDGLRDRRQTFRESAAHQLVACRDEGIAELAKVANITVGPAFRSSGYVAASDGVRLLRSANIGFGHLIWDETTAYWPTDDDSVSQLSLAVDDVVVTMKRPIVSRGLKVALISPYDVPSLLVQGAARIRAHDRSDSRWLFEWLRAPGVVESLLSSSGTSTGPPYLSATALRGATVPWPSKNRREHLLGRVLAATAVGERLERTLIGADDRADALRRSILKAAFEGHF